MDRHIYRARDKYTDKWVYGYYVCISNERNNYPAHLIISQDCDYQGFGKFGKMNVHEIDSNTLCQCIGWRDSNKIPIFENDIVGFGRTGSYRYKELVWYCKEMNMLTSVPLDGIRFNGCDYWNGKYPNVEYSTLCLMLQDPYGDFSEIKVLGNIIDNPELLVDEKIDMEEFLDTCKIKDKDKSAITFRCLEPSAPSEETTN